ncbi:MAG: DUF2807 domain-containing protein [Candidatus Doudnabacteria bacterium]|nr:DUF2807 domain-containing protein [Candidatus Doudnabacteria bacterium]
MKKTINISLGGYSYTVEEDAYEKLEDYINQLKKHFASYADSIEIVSDIESRLAEQLNLNAKGPKIVNLSAVEELIASMGNPEQFEDSENSSASGQEKQSSSFTGKKMFRNPDDVVLAGVSSGIAAYFGIDAVWIRILFVLLALGSGFGVLLYIVFWIALPEAKTGTEKIQMRGEPVNLKNVEAAVKERVEEFKKKDKSKAKQILAAPFLILGKIFHTIGIILKNVFPSLGRLLGALFSLAGGIIIASLFFITLNLLLNTNSPYLDFPFKSLATGAIYFVAVISAFLALLVPAIFLLLFGISLASLKPAFGKTLSLLLFGLFIVSASIFGSTAFNMAPEIEQAYQDSHYSAQETKEFNLKDFSIIESSDNFEITVLPSTEYKIIAKGTPRGITETQTYLEGENLIFTRDNHFRICIFCLNRPVKIEVYAPRLKAIKASGASKIWADGFMTQNFNIKLSGASKAYLNLQATQIYAQLSGASRLEFKGTGQNTDIKLSGASTADLQKAQLQNLSAELSGASKAYTDTLNQLEAKLSGASHLYYKTAVKITKAETSGASRLISNYEPNKNEDFINVTDPEAFSTTTPNTPSTSAY